MRTVMVRLLLDLYHNTAHLAFHDLLTTEPVVILYVGQLLGALSRFYAGDAEAIGNWLLEAGTVTSLAVFRAYAA